MDEKLFSLAPKSNLDPKDPVFKAYCDHLDMIYSDDTMRNIAIIGNRGSGKSSILRSYDRNRNNKISKFLYISLIDFENHTIESMQQDSSRPGENNQKHLEYSLLSQIFSHCTEDVFRGNPLCNIPYREAKLPKLSGKQWVLLYTFFLLFSVLQNNTLYSAILTLGNLSGKQGAILLGFMFLSIFSIGFYFLKLLYSYFRTSVNLSKMTIKTPHTEAEMFSNWEKYTLDQYKFELIYILDRLSSRIDHTVVFEDMERINSEISKDIMAKLRELNTLTNTYRETTNADSIPIRFIYALSDDVFDYEFRTKFFDTIMPVIPALNSKNVRHTLEMTLENANIAVDNRLIEIIAPHLTDYRTFRNILSEFILLRNLYYSKHWEKGWNIKLNSRILALATYKALYPQKYAYAFSEQGNSILPHLTEADFPKKDVILVRELFDESFLDTETLSLVGCYPITQLHKHTIHLLEHRSSDEKVKLLKNMKVNERPELKDDIIRLELFENEKDPYVAGMIANYVFSNPGVFIAKMVCGNPYMTQRIFINSLAYLSRFDTAYLRMILKQLGADNVSQWFVKYLVEYPMNCPNDYGWYKTWNNLWDTELGRVLVVCLGDSCKHLSPDLKNKHLGAYPLIRYIQRYIDPYCMK